VSPQPAAESKKQFAAAVAAGVVLRGSRCGDSDCKSGPDFVALLTLALALLHSPSQPLLAAAGVAAKVATIVVWSAGVF